MRIAIPLSGGRISQHFGHSEQFLFVEADMEQRTVLGKSIEDAPEHIPGRLPKWLVEHGVDTVIAGGVGGRARDLLAASSVKVLTGVSAIDPETIVSDFLSDRLKDSANVCDHSEHRCGH
jgi:predicted Fe-Mo cluster-binding NifX family protein